jgi:LacI family transcriptional regulator
VTTIRDVAREAGVSTATVSRVLNNVGPVDEQTRRRVRRVARRLQYIPNALGRGLSTQRTDAIGLLLPDLFGEFFSEILRGSDQTAQQSHYHLVVSSSHNNRQEIRAALAMMRGRVDGLVIMSPHIDTRTLRETLPGSLPVVLLNCPVHDDSFHSLTMDNFGGAYTMVRHLLGHGRRRIAVITGSEENLDAAERLRGYRTALEHAGAAPERALQVNGGFSDAGGYRAVRRLLSARRRPDAIFASNDSMAIGALSALREAGIRVPEEVALAGFDDIPIGAYLTPSLTSVRVDIHAFGSLAIQTVLNAVRGRNGHRKNQVVVPVTLRLRESCGCKAPVTPYHEQLPVGQRR